MRVRGEPLAGRQEPGVRERHRRRVDRLPRGVQRVDAFEQHPREEQRGDDRLDDQHADGDGGEQAAGLAEPDGLALRDRPLADAQRVRVARREQLLPQPEPAADDRARGSTRASARRCRRSPRPTKTNTWPIGDQNVAMSTVDSPVTQITETAVNSASTNGACSPEVVAIGSENSTVKTPTRPPNTRMAKRAALRRREVADRIQDAGRQRLALHRLGAHPFSPRTRVGTPTKHSFSRTALATLGYGRHLRRARRRHASRAPHPPPASRRGGERQRARDRAGHQSADRVEAPQGAARPRSGVRARRGPAPLLPPRHRAVRRARGLARAVPRRSAASRAPGARMPTPARPCSPRGRAARSAIASAVRRRTPRTPPASPSRPRRRSCRARRSGSASGWPTSCRNGARATDDAM